MGDVEKARRAAERAAREALQATYVSAVGDLGVATAQDAEAQRGVETAQNTARQLIDNARTESAALIEAARRVAATTASSYAEAHSAAIEVGWTPTQLRDMGYPSPTRRGKAAYEKSVPRASATRNSAAAVPDTATAEPLPDGSENSATALS